MLARSPVLSQFLLPADRVPEVLRVLLELEKSHFGAVRGKLALHAGVLVAKRKFPLYALVEAGQQIVNHPSLNEGRLGEPWFDTDTLSDFYRQYPTTQPTSHRHKFSNLAPIEVRRQFWLTEGYFDFDFLGGTADRHRLRYEGGAHPVRSAISYGWLRPRPTPLHRLGDIFRVWRMLEPLGSTQRHEIEAALGSRLDQWRGMEATARPVYKNFARTVLQDAFTVKRWEALSDEDRKLLLESAVDGLLLDTTQFFDHVVKGDGNNP